MFGMMRHLRQSKPKKDPPPGKQQAGYLWGSGPQIDTIGETGSWHFRVTEGQAIAYWSLWYGNREVGLSVYPTNECKDWTDVLYLMLLGLKGLAECPLDDDEIDEIRQSATDAANYTKGFQWLPENRKPKNPYAAGTLQAHMWDQAYKRAFANKYGSDFVDR